MYFKIREILFARHVTGTSIVGQSKDPDFIGLWKWDIMHQNRWTEAGSRCKRKMSRSSLIDLDSPSPSHSNHAVLTRGVRSMLKIERKVILSYRLSTVSVNQLKMFTCFCLESIPIS
jgi:hypothetical protein